MSWKYYENIKCKDCNYEFQYNISTLNKNSKTFRRCPKCGGYTEVIEQPKPKIIILGDSQQTKMT